MSGHVDLSKLEVKESREYHHGTTLIYHVIEESETNMLTAKEKNDSVVVRHRLDPATIALQYIPILSEFLISTLVQIL